MRSCRCGEIGGRAFFGNTGKTHNDGAEVGLTVTPVTGLTLERRLHLRALSLCAAASSTATAFPGCPSTTGDSASAPRCPAASSSTPTTRSAPRSRPTTRTRIIVDSWGAGVTNLRLGWDGDVGGLQPQPVPRREQPVGPPVRRLGDPERSGRTGVRARAAAGGLPGSGDRVPRQTDDGVSGRKRR